MANLYFSPAIDNQWSELGNWFLDSSFTDPATALPGPGDDVYIFNASVSSMSPAPTVASITVETNEPWNNYFFEGALTVTGAATFTRVPLAPGSNITAPTVSFYVYDYYGGNFGTVTGNALFEAYPWEIFVESNFGTVTGNATFYNANNTSSGIVGGSATFTEYSVNVGSVNTVAGTSTFNGAENRGVVAGPATFNGSALNAGDVNNTAVFNNNAANVYSTAQWWWWQGGSENYGTINGAATFNDSAQNSGTINGNATFNNGAQLTQSTSFSYNGQPSINGNAVFKNNSNVSGSGSYEAYSPIINGNCTFEDNSFCEISHAYGESNLRHQSNNGTVTFRDAAANRNGLGEWGGRIVFAPARGINGTSILGAI